MVLHRVSVTYKAITLIFLLFISFTILVITLFIYLLILFLHAECLFLFMPVLWSIPMKDFWGMERILFLQFCLLGMLCMFLSTISCQVSSILLVYTISVTLVISASEPFSSGILQVFKFYNCIFLGMIQEEEEGILISRWYILFKNSID